MMDNSRFPGRRLPMWGCLAALALAAGAGLIFVPLFLAIVEHLLFGSGYVEGWFRTIGLHEALGRIYAPFVQALRWVVGRP